MSKHKLVEKVTARVFCQLEGVGGHPVTIFSTTQTNLTNSNQSQLARTCDGDSVFVKKQANGRGSTITPAVFSFYQSTGDQIPFCAPAALGGIHEFTATFTDAEKKERRCFQSTMQPESTYEAEYIINDVISLHFSELPWEEETVSNFPLLHRLIKSLSLPDDMLIQHPRHSGLPDQAPTFCNSSVFGSPTTLVYVNNVPALRAAVAPLPRLQKYFTNGCRAIDSTGVCLYTRLFTEAEQKGSLERRTTWECRNFPVAAGYTEGPATGNSVVALAASLVAREVSTPSLQLHQRTAVGTESLFLIDFHGINEDGKISYQLTGHVQVDKRETVEVTDDSDDSIAL